jgi:sensor c-di-GMP phosphodiesterase-like protein
MYWLKITVCLSICALLLGTFVAAQQNKLGVADKYQIAFLNPIRVGNVLLPQGDYQIVHTMEGDTHVMVFTQKHVKDPVETRAKCSLVPLQEKAPQNQTVYALNANNENVLVELVFKGETTKHVFSRE